MWQARRRSLFSLPLAPPSHGALPVHTVTHTRCWFCVDIKRPNLLRLWAHHHGDGGVAVLDGVLCEDLKQAVHCGTFLLANVTHIHVAIVTAIVILVWGLPVVLCTNTKQCTHQMCSQRMHTSNVQPTNAYIKCAANDCTHQMCSQRLHTSNVQPTTAHIKCAANDCTHLLCTHQMCTHQMHMSGHTWTRKQCMPSRWPPLRVRRPQRGKCTHIVCFQEVPAVRGCGCCVKSPEVSY